MLVKYKHSDADSKKAWAQLLADILAGVRFPRRRNGTLVNRGGNGEESIHGIDTQVPRLTDYGASFFAREYHTGRVGHSGREED